MIAMLKKSDEQIFNEIISRNFEAKNRWSIDLAWVVLPTFLAWNLYVIALDLWRFFSCQC